MLHRRMKLLGRTSLPPPPILEYHQQESHVTVTSSGAVTELLYHKRLTIPAVTIDYTAHLQIALLFVIIKQFKSKG